jgi:asparagine synthase (glutamine-hydrolysing)
MCGIIWIFWTSENNKTRATHSLEKITHRGSSNFEVQIFPGGSIIGANRLPIQWRNNWFQPIANEDTTIWACQNGEIFNYSTLRKELEEKWHVFSTDCDTELWVHLYEEYGVEAVNHIDSEMFASIIYDVNNNHIYVCRDQLGVKPLYYAYHTDGTLHFASEMKQLVQFDDIDVVREFPQGHYFFAGDFVQYTSIEENLAVWEITDEKQAINLLTDVIVEAVRKRVDTDLPIGVFLSWWVDSSLIMEIATRFHPDVTAIILWKEWSSDYEYALRLCMERKYKYHVIHPDENYWQEIDEMIYYCETYEPLIIRHAFANNFCSKVAQQLWLKIVLLGEWADELFCGYNEFSYLSDAAVTQWVLKLTNNLWWGHLKRVDRLAMKYTVEPRCPFLDKKVVQAALNISNNLKIKKENHNITVKYILRTVAAQFLPEYIAYRYKMPFANWAGMWVGNNYKKSDGEIADYINKKWDFLGELSEELKNKYEIITNYEAYHLLMYNKYQFNKLHDWQKRIVVKDVLHSLEPSWTNKLLIAEFDYIPLYFPVYYASYLWLYEQHWLDVDFISTKGDYETYFSLVNNTAQIWLSDPLFTMGQPLQWVWAKIIGELVTGNPLVAISINPSIHISTLEDFQQHTIGSYKKFTTAHTFASSLVWEHNVLPYEKKDILQMLINRDIDIAIVLYEDASEIERVWWKIIYSFWKEYEKFCFTWMTTTTLLWAEYDISTRWFLVAVQETIREIRKNPEKAQHVFALLFWEFHKSEEIFNVYRLFRKDDILPNEYNAQKSFQIWKTVYPQMMNWFQWGFFQKDYIQSIIKVFTANKFKKDHPFLEEKLYEIIKSSVENNVSIPLFMFWWCSEKKSINERDIATLDYLNQLQVDLKEVYPPGYVLTLILADEHWLNNSYALDDIHSYFHSLIPELDAREIKYIYLSTLFQKYNFNRNEQLTEIQTSLSDNWREEVSIKRYLEETAAKNYNGENSVYGAQQYYLLRTLEKSLLEKFFVWQVFLTYSWNYIQSILPYMPTLYLFTEKKWYSELPWFN